MSHEKTNRLREPIDQTNEDVRLARNYIAKFASSCERGIVFELTFCEYKQLMQKRRCHYTNIELCASDGVKQVGNTRTIDRINYTKGYVKDNCVACCYAVNKFKSMFENDFDWVNMYIGPVKAIKILNSMIKMEKNRKKIKNEQKNHIQNVEGSKTDQTS